MKRTAREIQNESNAKALKRARVMLALTRKEIGLRLNVSDRAVEKYESGRDLLSDQRLERITMALGITREEFNKVKKGKKIRTRAREKKVISNFDRRSYQRIITKECEVLRSLRRVKGISQYEASQLCGYSKATIGHIENGRIELSQSRIKHIVGAYGREYAEFVEAMGKQEQRDQTIDWCIERIQKLDEQKLVLFKNFLMTI